MKIGSLGRVALLASSIMIGAVAGCGAGGPDTDYGLSRGTSLNGTAAFAEMLRGRGFTVRAAVRLTDELAKWSDGLVRFAPYPGPPEADEAKWFTRWLEEDPDRWLIYVVRDFDTAAEYWKQIRDAIPEADQPERRAEAEENRAREAGWVHELPEKPKKTGDAREWFAVEAGAVRPKFARSWRARGPRTSTAVQPPCGFMKRSCVERGPFCSRAMARRCCRQEFDRSSACLDHRQRLVLAERSPGQPGSPRAVPRGGRLAGA